MDNCASRRFDKCLILMQWGRGISYRSFKYYSHQVHRIQKGSQIIYLYSPNIQDGIEPFSTVGITKCSRLNIDSIHTVGWCSGTTAHFLRRRLGVQTQSEAGMNQYLRQATKLWLVEALLRALKVTRVHSGSGLRLPMLQRYSCTERTVAETHKKRRSTPRPLAC